METRKDTSYGVIPIIKKNAKWNVFLINQYGSTGEVYWTLPKGHPEKGENPEETARRELNEETSIRLSKLNTAKEYIQTYTFQFSETIFEKTVVYYVGIAADTMYSIQETEVKEAGWFTFTQAQEKVTYQNLVKILQEVYVNIENDVCEN